MKTTGEPNNFELTNIICNGINNIIDTSRAVIGSLIILDKRLKSENSDYRSRIMEMMDIMTIAYSNLRLTSKKMSSVVSVIESDENDKPYNDIVNEINNIIISLGKVIESLNKLTTDTNNNKIYLNNIIRNVEVVHKKLSKAVCRTLSNN